MRILILALALLACASAFLAKNSMRKSSLVSDKMQFGKLDSKVVTGAAGMVAALLPASPAFAVGDSAASGAVGIPLIISVLVMVPFLYYQQALRPKDKDKPAQIELDKNLKVKNKGDVSSGRAGQAKAGKRK